MSKTNPTGRVSETRFSLLEQRVEGIEHALRGLTDKIESWMSSRTTNPWRIIALLLGILVPLGFILNLYITSAISPWAAIANQAKASSEANSVSVSRIYEGQSKMLENFASERSERLSVQREIETQFDADSQLRNVQWATMMRRQNDVQNALHDMGAKMPAAADGPYFFPNISGRNGKQNQ